MELSFSLCPILLPIPLLILSQKFLPINSFIRVSASEFVFRVPTLKQFMLVMALTGKLEIGILDFNHQAGDENPNTNRH